jgi:hypothetical protein
MRDVLRGSFVRVHEQVGGRDYATSSTPQPRSPYRDVYDNNGDGIFETEFPWPASTPTVAS